MSRMPIDRVEKDLPGLVFSVCSSGNHIRHYCSGYADVEKKEDMNENHLFEIGDITCTFTAVIALRLVESGVLDLDMPLAALANQYHLDGGRLKLIVDLYPYLKPLTLRSLLNHTSGLPAYNETIAYEHAFIKNPNKTWQVESYLDLITGESVQYRFGYQVPVKKLFSYSGTNYIIVALILSAAVGRRFRYQMQELFDTFHLGESAYLLRGLVKDKDDDKNLNKIAHGYMPVSHVDAVPFSNLPALYYNDNKMLSVHDVTKTYRVNGMAGSAVVSTTTDLVHFFRQLINNGVLTSTFRDMFSVVPIHVKGGFKDSLYYGLGVYKTITKQYGEIIWNAGNNYGYSVLVGHGIGYNITFALAYNISFEKLDLYHPLSLEVMEKVFSRNY